MVRTAPDGPRARDNGPVSEPYATGAHGRYSLPPRHPHDPAPVPATKARAVLLLGVGALLTGPLLGGVVPATVALVLAGQFRREAYAADGFLTGARVVRRGERLAWCGVLLAAAAVAAAVVAWLFQVAAGSGGPAYPPGVD